MIKLQPVELETLEKEKKPLFSSFTGNTPEERRVWILENLEKEFPEETPFLFSCIQSIKEILRKPSFIKRLREDQDNLKVFNEWSLKDFECPSKLFSLLQELKRMRF